MIFSQYIQKSKQDLKLNTFFDTKTKTLQAFVLEFHTYKVTDKKMLLHKNGFRKTFVFSISKKKKISELNIWNRDVELIKIVNKFIKF